MASKFYEFKFGWPVVFASAIGIGLGMSPLPFYTIGVFAEHFIAEFAWSQGFVMAGLGPFGVTAVIMGPIIGLLADRYGPRRVVLISIPLFSLTMMSFSLQTGSAAQYIVTWCLLAVFGAGTLPITWTRTVIGWFFHKRGLALGFSLVGTGLLGIFAKQYAFFMIDAIGWRMAYVAVGALPLLIAWPIALFMFRDVDDPQMASKVANMHKASDKPIAKQGGLSLKQAARDWRFWLLAYSFVPISFAVGGPIPNMETILGEKGFDRTDAVNLASVLGIAVIFGRIAGGYIIDHFWAPAVAAIILSLPATATYMLAQPDFSMLYAATAIFILGAAAGVEYDLMAYLVSRYFGQKHYAAIYGCLYGFFAVGAAFGPGVFGSSFDKHGSYDSILMLSSILFIVGSLPLLLLGKYRDYIEPEDDATR